MSDDAPIMIPEAVPPPKARDAAALVQIGERGIQLRSLEDLLRFGRLLVEAGVAPRGMSAGGVAIAVQAGLERGLGLLGGPQACVVINGNLSWRGVGGRCPDPEQPGLQAGDASILDGGRGR